MDYAMSKQHFFMRYFFNFCNYTKVIISHACSRMRHSFPSLFFFTEVFFDILRLNISDLVVHPGKFMQHRSSSLKSSFPIKRTKQGKMAQLVTSVDSSCKIR